VSTFRVKGLNLATGGVVGERVLDDGHRQEGELRPLPEGRPLDPGAELVQIEDCDEPDAVRLTTLPLDHAGPSRASTRAYRAGYDAIFGKPKHEVN